MEGSSTLIEIWGPAGVIIIALATACMLLYRALIASQDARVRDAQAVAQTLLTLQQQHNTVTAEMAHAMLGLKDTFEGLQSTLGELRTELRDLRDRRGGR